MLFPSALPNRPPIRLSILGCLLRFTDLSYESSAWPSIASLSAFVALSVFIISARAPPSPPCSLPISSAIAISAFVITPTSARDFCKPFTIPVALFFSATGRSFAHISTSDMSRSPSLGGAYFPRTS